MATYVTPLPGHGPGPTGPKPPLRMVNRSPSLLRNGSCNLKSNAAKRKSAVELLQESKAFYVKSEQVLDSKQELKHSEHLQVTANPNFDVLLKTPVRVSHSWEGHGAPNRKSETATRTAAQTQLIQNSTTTTQTLLQLHEHHHNNHVVHQQTHNSDHSLAAPKAQQHTNFNHVIHEGVAIIVPACNQPPVPPRTLQPPPAAVAEVPKGTSAPGLPPKSPRSLRPRSKTQPEPSCVAIANQCFQLGPHNHNHNHNHNQRPEYRRSHSERDTSDDFQIRLRRLLYTDSKENLDKVCPHPTAHIPKTPVAKAVCPASSCPTGAVATCTHKSMPDLSPLKLRQCCRRPQGSTSTTSTSSSEHPLPPVTPSSPAVAACAPALDQSNGISVRRPILRSKSDISHRYSKSGPDLTQCGAGAATNRSSRSLADLERFFDKMGLNGGAFYQLHAGPSDSSPPVFFNSVSSLSSSCCKAGGTSEEESATATPQCHASAAARETQAHREGLTNDNLSQHGPVETSIVERNARVIKWLYNCRKAS